MSKYPLNRRFSENPKIVSLLLLLFLLVHVHIDNNGLKQILPSKVNKTISEFGPSN